MAGINAIFERMGNIVDKYMNTDLIDIGRWVLFQQPSGFWREEFKNPYFVNIPCHVDFHSMDNPEPNSLDVQPIVTSIIIYCNNAVDLQSGDFVTAKKIDSKGEVLQIYKGVIGLAQVEQSRKSVSMLMSTLGTGEDQREDIEFYSFVVKEYPQDHNEIINDYKIIQEDIQTKAQQRLSETQLDRISKVVEKYQKYKENTKIFNR